MWTIIIFAVVMAIILCVGEYKISHIENRSGYLFKIIAGLVIGGFIGFFVALNIPMETKLEKTTHELLPFRNNKNVKEKCIYYLNVKNNIENTKYSFYYKENNGMCVLKTIDSNNSIVKFTNNKSKVIEFNKVKVKDAFINYFAIDGSCLYKCEIYVPEGTINFE